MVKILQDAEFATVVSDGMAKILLGERWRSGQPSAYFAALFYTSYLRQVRHPLKSQRHFQDHQRTGTGLNFRTGTR